MGNIIVSNDPVPVRSAVPEGKTRICVAGWKMSPHVGRASNVARTIASKFPNKYETWFFFSFGMNLRGENGDGNGGLYRSIKDMLHGDDKTRLQGHRTVPFCWMESSDGSVKGIGGRDNLCEWVQTQPELMADDEMKTLATTQPSTREIAFFDQSPGTAQR